jgi:hypothetical protein
MNAKFVMAWIILNVNKDPSLEKKGRKEEVIWVGTRLLGRWVGSCKV